MLRRAVHAIVLLVLGLALAPGLAVASPARPIVYSKVNWEWVPGPDAMREASRGGLFAALKGKARQLTDAPGDAQPNVSPDGSVIAFTRGGDIYEVDPDGSTVPRRLTSGPEIDERPLFSPSGRYLVFARRASREGPSDLYAVTAGGGTAHPLVTSPEEESEASFSPDGKAVAFVRSLPLPGGGTNDEIYAVRTASAQLARLTRTAEDEFSPRYFAGGIVFDRRRVAIGRPAAIFTMRRDGTRVRALVNRGKLPAIVSAVSPNGRLLLFGSQGLWAKPLIHSGSGSSRPRLLVKGGNGRGLVFSPDGRRVAGIFTYPGMIYVLVSISIRTGASRGEGEVWEAEAPGPTQTNIGPTIAW